MKGPHGKDMEKAESVLREYLAKKGKIEVHFKGKGFDYVKTLDDTNTRKWFKLFIQAYLRGQISYEQVATLHFKLAWQGLQVTNLVKRSGKAYAFFVASGLIDDLVDR